MEEVTSGWLTAMMSVVGIVILGVALVYAVMMWHRRRTDPAAKDRQDRATEQVYRESEREEKRRSAPPAR